MNIIKKVLSLVSIILFPFLAVISAIRLALTPIFINLEYHLPGFPPDSYGFTTADRLKWGQYSINYLLGKISHVEFTAQTLPDGSPLFNTRELSHMLDVRNLTEIVLTFWLVICVFFIVALLVSILGEWFSEYKRALKTGGILTILLVVTILLSVWMNFNLLFTMFHQLFFQGNSWLFYVTDNLIRLFPLRFWRDLFIFIGSLTILISLLPILIRVKSASRKS